MLIPSTMQMNRMHQTSLSRRVNANSQLGHGGPLDADKLIKKGEC